MRTNKEEIAERDGREGERREFVSICLYQFILSKAVKLLLQPEPFPLNGGQGQTTAEDVLRTIGDVWGQAI
jgi:hypothetical protein